MAGMVVDEEFFKKIFISVILAVLLLLSFFILKPILLSIIMGVILAIVLETPYNKILYYLKSKTLSAAVICILILLSILIPLWFLTPIFIEQSLEAYHLSQQIDLASVLNKFFTFASPSDTLSGEVGGILNSFIAKATNSLLNYFSKLILEFPSLLLQLFVVFCTLFFVLRDSETIIANIHNLIPFSKNIEDKLFKSSKDITLSVIYGHIFIGIMQGIIVGLGFLIFGVSNSLFLMLLAIIAGIIPTFIGTAIVWVPVIVYLFLADNNFAAFGVLVFGLFAGSIDNVIRPIFISKKSKMHPFLALVGMIGGFFFFGFLGFILGPLIIAYIIIFLEVYRGKEVDGIFIKR
ncbi:MAG: AI-2E family transporter [Nanoarchaeota archaeon]